MKQIVPAICLTVIASSLVIAVPGDAKKLHHRQPATCDTAHGHVITADSQAVLYETPERFERPVVYGCVFGHHHSYELGYLAHEGACSSSGCLDIHHETLAGMMAAYEFFSVTGEEETFLIIVRDLRTGRVLQKIPTGTPRPQNSTKAVGAGFASAIVLKKNGSVAWINERPLGEATEYQVHALNKTGNRILATGTNIDPHSLALAGSTLYWTQGDKPFSTYLR